ncbi:phage tail assembly protein [Treponema pectinovorum]|uniref:phage tail assembly protein n=1 Tax=Treponema pectinovorum TaxID=164 RepID=UPI0011C8DE8C|nr:phage tail assembly protein [Treponema pectinovorum]
MEEWKYTLKTPVTVGERTVEQLNFHRPKVRDFLRTDGFAVDSIGADQALCSALTGEPEVIVSAIDIEDWAVIRVELQKAWLKFFGIKPQKKADAEAEETAKQNP